MTQERHRVAKSERGGGKKGRKIGQITKRERVKRRQKGKGRKTKRNKVKK
jgi:hypothetical protein